jgi:hypothetical protein
MFIESIILLLEIKNLIEKWKNESKEDFNNFNNFINFENIYFKENYNIIEKINVNKNNDNYNENELNKNIDTNLNKNIDMNLNKNNEFNKYNLLINVKILLIIKSSRIQLI